MELINFHDIDNIYQSLIILLSSSSFEHEMPALKIEHIADINNEFACSVLTQNRIILKDNGVFYKKIRGIMSDDIASYNLSKDLTVSYPPLLEEFTLTLAKIDCERSYSCFNLRILKTTSPISALRSLATYIKSVYQIGNKLGQQAHQHSSPTLMFPRV